MVEYFKKSRKRKFKRDIMSTKFKSPVYNVIAVPMDKNRTITTLIMWPKEMDLLYQSIKCDEHMPIVCL
jgi:hypothetical protein